MRSLSFLLACLFYLNSQAQIKTEVIHPVIGETIEAEENKVLHLFPFISDSLFEKAFLFSRNDTCCFLEFQKKDGSRSTKRISAADKAEYARIIDNRLENNPALFKNNILINEYTLRDGTTRRGVVLKETEKEINLDDLMLGTFSIPVGEITERKAIYFYQSVILDLADGETIKGNLLKVSKNGVQIKNPYQEQTLIEWSKITKMTILWDKEEGFAERPFKGNPNATRFLFAPSAIPMKKGEGYYQNIYFLFNSINYGLTNHISISGGLIIPLAVFANIRAASKIANNFYLGGGIIAGTSIINLSNDNIRAGIGYGLATLGNENYNISAGVGYGFAGIGDSTGFADRPIVTINGIAKLSKRVSLVTENWIFPVKEEKDNTYMDPQTGVYYYRPPTITKTYYSILSIGTRFKLSQNSTMDFALLKLPAEAGLLFLPYLDFVYHF